MYCALYYIRVPASVNMAGQKIIMIPNADSSDARRPHL
jgi:hypothetical protein